MSWTLWSFVAGLAADHEGGEHAGARAKGPGPFPAHHVFPVSHVLLLLPTVTECQRVRDGSGH